MRLWQQIAQQIAQTDASYVRYIPCTGTLNPKRCPLCRSQFPNRYEHMVTAHGWKREGEVFERKGEAA